MTAAYSLYHTRGSKFLRRSINQAINVVSWPAAMQASLLCGFSNPLLVDYQELARSRYIVGFSLVEYEQVRSGLVELGCGQSRPTRRPQGLITPVTYHRVPLCGQPIFGRLSLSPLPHTGFLGLWELIICGTRRRSGNVINRISCISLKAKAPPPLRDLVKTRPSPVADLLSNVCARTFHGILILNIEFPSIHSCLDPVEHCCTFYPCLDPIEHCSASASIIEVSTNFTLGSHSFSPSIKSIYFTQFR